MPAMLDQYVKRILQSRVYDVPLETPIHAAPLISRRIGNRVLLKREDLQPVFSFKPVSYTHLTLPTICSV